MASPYTTSAHIRSLLSASFVTLQSQWAPLRLQSLATRVFTQPFVKAHIKENIKAPRHWPLWGESTGDRWIPFTKGSNPENDDVIMFKINIIGEDMSSWWTGRNDKSRISFHFIIYFIYKQMMLCPSKGIIVAQTFLLKPNDILFCKRYYFSLVHHFASKWYCVLAKVLF